MADSSGIFNPGDNWNNPQTYMPDWSGWNLTPTGTGRGYYNPNSTYGGGYGNQWDQNAFTNTAVGRYYMNQQPDAAWTRYTTPIIGQGNDAFGAWVNSQKGRVMDAYQAALATNPNLDLYGQFLPQMGGFDQWMQQFLALSPQQRGEPTAGVAGQARWVPRL